MPDHELSVPMRPDANERVRLAVDTYAAAREQGDNHEQAMAKLQQATRPGASIEGVTEWLRSDGDECICCEGRHVFTRLLRLPADAPAKARQFSDSRPDVVSWLHRAIADMPEGARVRVTVEVVPDRSRPWCDTCKGRAVWRESEGWMHASDAHPFGDYDATRNSDHEVTAREWNAT